MLAKYLINAVLSNVRSGGVCMVFRGKGRVGFRNVGGDRFNKVHRLQRLVVVVVFSGFRGGKGMAGLVFRNAGG